MQDAFHTILLREYFVMHFDLLLHLIKFILISLCSARQLPELVLIPFLNLKLFSILLDQLRIVLLTERDRVIGSLGILLLKQVGHLMDDAEADIVVRFDLHVALLNGATKRLKVHAHLGNFNFDWSQDKRMVTGAFLLGVEDTLEDLTLVLELVLRLDLF